MRVPVPGELNAIFAEKLFHELNPSVSFPLLSTSNLAVSLRFTSSHIKSDAELGTIRDTNDAEKRHSSDYDTLCHRHLCEVSTRFKCEGTRRESCYSQVCVDCLTAICLDPP